MVELTQMLCAKSVERKFPAREFRTKSVVAAMNFLKAFTETEASMMLHLSAVHPSEDFGSYGPSIGQWMFENFIGWMGRMCHRQHEPEETIMVVMKAVLFCQLANPQGGEHITEKLLQQSNRIPMLTKTVSLMRNPSGIPATKRDRGVVDLTSMRGVKRREMDRTTVRRLKCFFGWNSLSTRVAARRLPQEFLEFKSVVVGGYRRESGSVHASASGSTYSSGVEVSCDDGVVRFGNVNQFIQIIKPSNGEPLVLALVHIYHTLRLTQRSEEPIVNLKAFEMRNRYTKAQKLLRMVTFASVLPKDMQSRRDRKVLYCTPEY